MKIFKGLFSGGVLALGVIVLGAMMIFNAMAGSEGTANRPANVSADSRSRDFGPIHILVGVTANETDGSTVNLQGITESMIVCRDSGGVSTVTPQIKPATGSTVSATDWIPLDAAVLSGTTSDVTAYPQINGNYMMRFAVTACTSCVTDCWWSGQRDN